MCPGAFWACLLGNGGDYTQGFARNQARLSKVFDALIFLFLISHFRSVAHQFGAGHRHSTCKQFAPNILQRYKSIRMSDTSRLLWEGSRKIDFRQMRSSHFDVTSIRFSSVTATTLIAHGPLGLPGNELA